MSRRKKPRRRRRLILGFTLLFVALIGLALSNLDYIANTKLVTGLIKAKLKKKIRGRFTFSHITTDLGNTLATVHDAHVWYEDGTKVLDAGEVTFDIHLTALLFLKDDITRIHGKDVKLFLWTDEDKVFLYQKIWVSYAGKKKLKHMVRAVSMENADFIYEYRPNGFRIELEGLTGDSRIFDKRLIFAQAKMKKVHVISKSFDDTFRDVTVDGVIDKERFLEIYSLKAMYENLPLDISGRMEPVRPYQIIDFHVKTAGDIPDALKMLKYTGTSKGKFELSANVEGPPNDYQVNGDAKSPAGNVSGLDFTALKGAFVYLGRTIFAKKFSFHAFGMKFDGKLNYDFAKSTFDFDTSILLKGVSYRARGEGITYLSRRVVKLTRLNITTPTMRLDASGDISLTGKTVDFDVDIQTTNPDRDLRVIGLSGFKGRMEATGTIEGKYLNPHVRAHVEFNDFNVRDFPVGDGEAEIELKDGTLFIDDMISRVDGGTIEGRGNIRVMTTQARPIGAGAMKLNATATARGIDLKQRYPGKELEGSLDVDIRFDGSMAKPLGKGKARVNKLKFLTQEFEVAEGPITVTGQWFELDGWKLELPFDTHIDATARLWFDGKYSFDLGGDDLDVQDLTLVNDKKLPLAGRFSLRASGEAYMDHPKATGEVRLNPFYYKENDFAPANIKFSVDNSVVSLDGQLYENVSVFGAYNVNTGAFNDMAVYLDNTPLELVFDWIGREGEGMITGAFMLNGGEKGLRDIEFGISISDLQMKLSGLQMHNEGEIYMILGPKRTLIRSAELKGEAGYIIIESPSRMGNNLDANFVGELEIKALRPFTKQIRSGEGNAFLSGGITGPYLDPKIFGTIMVNASSLRLAAYNSEIEDFEMKMDFNTEQIEIETMKGISRDGNFYTSGFIHFSGEKAGYVDLKLSMTEMPIVSPGEYYIAISGDIELKGDKSGSVLKSEEIFINQGRYIKDVVFLSGAIIEPGRETELKTSYESAFLRNMRLDLLIRDPGNFLIRNNLANMYLKTNLDVTGLLTNPSVDGSIEAVGGGKIFYRTISFDLEQAILDFPGSGADAEVNVIGTTERREWVITLTLEGKLSKMNLTLSATPELEDTDILTMLVFSKTTEELKQEGSSGFEAISLLVNKGWLQPITSPLEDSTGLNLKGVEMGGGDEGTSITIRVGVTKWWDLKYTSVFGEDETIKRAGADFKLTDRIILSGTQDNMGVFNFQLKFHFAFE